MSWSLVTVAPNAETRACYNMALFDFPHHVFKLPCQVVVRGQVRERLRPAFPGYAIVDVGDRWRELKEVSGVTGFVRGTEGHIAALSDAAVRDLLAGCSPDHPDDEVLVVEPTQSERFRAGDRVRVSNWSYDTDAVFERVGRDGKAFVSLDWLGRQVTAEVDESELTLDTGENQGDYPRPKSRNRRRKRYRLSSPPGEGVVLSGQRGRFRRPSAKHAPPG